MPFNVCAVRRKSMVTFALTNTSPFGMGPILRLRRSIRTSLSFRRTTHGWYSSRHLQDFMLAEPSRLASGLLWARGFVPGAGELAVSAGATTPFLLTMFVGSVHGGIVVCTCTVTRVFIATSPRTASNTTNLSIAVPWSAGTLAQVTLSMRGTAAADGIKGFECTGL